MVAHRTDELRRFTPGSESITRKKKWVCIRQLPHAKACPIPPQHKHSKLALTTGKSTPTLTIIPTTTDTPTARLSHQLWNQPPPLPTTPNNGSAETIPSESNSRPSPSEVMSANDSPPVAIATSPQQLVPKY